MDSLKRRRPPKEQRKFADPSSTLIESTAYQFACTFYEVGRSQGLTSKYKTHKHYAARYMKQFIPLAVDTLMKMLANDATPQIQRDAIYDAFLERTNDVDLANTIPLFDNPLAATFKSDLKPERINPIIVNTGKPIEPSDNATINTAATSLDKLPLEKMLQQALTQRTLDIKEVN